MRMANRAALALVLLLVPALANAQINLGSDGSGRSLRDRARPGGSGPRLEENIKKLESEDPEERIEGVRGLAELNDPKGIDYLIAAANDPDKRICVKAIDSLGQARAKEAVPLLTQKLFMRDTDLAAKQRILAALGKIGDKRATGPILDFLSRGVDHPVHGNAIFALGEIGDPKALPALEAIAAETDDPMLRGLALDTVRKIRERPEPPVVPPSLAVDRRGGGGGGAEAQ